MNLILLFRKLYCFGPMMLWVACLAVCLVTAHNSASTDTNPKNSTSREHLWVDGIQDLPGFQQKYGGSALDVALVEEHTDRSQFIEMECHPKQIHDGEDVLISWKGVKNPTTKDFISISCGPTSGVRDYIDKQRCSRPCPSSGSMRFTRLVMMRCDYNFLYFNFDKPTNTYHIVGNLTVHMSESFNTPKQIHLALTTEKDAMAVMYNSGSKRTPEVKYGEETKSGQLDQHEFGTSTTYSADDMCQEPANTTAQDKFRDAGFMHTVVMTGLKPGTMYYYRVGNDVDGWSEEKSFVSRPSDHVKEAKFIAYADMGVYDAPQSVATAKGVFEEVLLGYDSFLLHFGDISYARGTGYLWDQFFHLIEPYASKIPYMISLGNHEYDHTWGGEKDPSKAAGNGFHPSWGNFGADSGGECAVPMVHRWHAPKSGFGIFWYSFDYGGVHVVQMSSEHDWTKTSEQYEWIEKDLRSVNRSVTPWVVLTSHRMMYTTELGFDGDLNVSVRFREAMEDLLWKYEVNLMLVGHQHSYERSCSVYQTKCRTDGKGTVHMVVGAAGYDLDDEPFSSDIGNWSLVHGQIWGYLKVASTDKEMKLEFVDNERGNVYDSVTIRAWGVPNEGE